ncbi:MAG: GldG family protein, partial [Chloroflexota bacterium]|nr:GldG family protein [Chloroflexota bacterium]
MTPANSSPQGSRALIAVLAGFAALGFGLISLIYWVAFANGTFDTPLRVLVIAAVVLFSIYLVASPESVGRAAQKRGNRLAANAIVASLVAVAIAIVLNIIVAQVPTVRADWTAGQDFTLSQQTINILQGFDARNETVTAYAFYSDRQPGATSRTQIEDLLKEYQAHTSRIKYEFVDPYVSPVRAQEYGITQLGTVVFDNGKRREIANSITEADFTGALVRLDDVRTKTVAFLTGHGERDPNGADQNGYSQVNAALSKDNYQTITWNLVTSPTLTLDRVTVLVIAEPTKPLTMKEVGTIRQYLDAGGHALLLMDPAMPPAAQAPLAAILAKYGVTPVQGIVIDQHSAAQQQTLVVVNTFPANDITRAMTGLVTLFPESLGLKPPTSTVGTFTVTPIIQSSPGESSSWLETDLKNNAARYDPGVDIPGPVTMGLSIGPQALTASTPATATNQIKTRLVAYGDGDFPSNIVLAQAPSNVDLFANSVSWLAGANELVSIRPKDPSVRRTVTLDNT